MFVTTAVEEEVEIGKGDPNLLTDSLYPLDHALRRILRRR
jgi:hypothetical protein